MVVRTLRIPHPVQRQESPQSSGVGRLCGQNDFPGTLRWDASMDNLYRRCLQFNGKWSRHHPENKDGTLIEVSLALSFPTSNNQAEYEAFLAGLRLVEDLGAEEVKIFTDSQLVAFQVRVEYMVKNNHLFEYWALVQERKKKF